MGLPPRGSHFNIASSLAITTHSDMVRGPVDSLRVTDKALARPGHLGGAGGD